jgi:hypothetical protein
VASLTADRQSPNALTREFIHHSPNYLALGRDARLVADNVVDDVTAGIGSGAWSIIGYKAAVQTMARSGWLTSAQQAVLVELADAL